MKKPKPKASPILWVEILEAKPNKMFTEQQRAAIRFLRYSQRIPCAECGKKLHTHWTMLCQFIATRPDKSMFVLADGKSHAPLTPVCGDHPLRPDWPKPAKKK